MMLYIIVIVILFAFTLELFIKYTKTEYNSFVDIIDDKIVNNTKSTQTICTPNTTINEEDQYPLNEEDIDQKHINQITENCVVSAKAVMWKYTQRISKSITLSGTSRSGVRSCFYCPELSTYFDAGLQGLSAANMIFLTHGHADHSHGLPMMNLEFDSKVKLFVPAEIVSDVISTISSFYRINGNLGTTVTSKYEVIGVNPNITIDIKLDDVVKETPIGSTSKTKIKVIPGKQYLIETFKCYHSVPTVGYGIYEKRKKIKPEYEQLPGKEIGQLRNMGIEINYIKNEPIIAYLGDTTEKVFQDPKNINLYNFPYIITECTYIYSIHMEEAKRGGHSNWHNLMPIIQAYPYITFILIHFSPRYTITDLYKFFKKEFEDYKIGNVVVWYG
jgi:ribonuclease Z